MANCGSAKCNVRPEKEFLKGKDVSVGELDLKGGFIRSVRVCKAGFSFLGGGFDAFELKGIKIRPAVVSASGDVNPKEVKPEELPTLIQPQCPNDRIASTSDEGWDIWVSCPTDQVLTGLNVAYREKRITALSVLCKRVGWFTVPKEPVQDAWETIDRCGDHSQHTGHVGNLMMRAGSPLGFDTLVKQGQAIKDAQNKCNAETRK